MTVVGLRRVVRQAHHERKEGLPRWSDVLITNGGGVHGAADPRRLPSDSLRDPRGEGRSETYPYWSRGLGLQVVAGRDDALREGAHAELLGDAQRLVQQRQGLGAVSGAVALEECVGVVAERPGQLRAIA